MVAVHSLFLLYAQEGIRCPGRRNAIRMQEQDAKDGVWNAQRLNIGSKYYQGTKYEIQYRNTVNMQIFRPDI